MKLLFRNNEDVCQLLYGHDLMNYLLHTFHLYGSSLTRSGTICRDLTSQIMLQVDSDLT